MNPFDLFKNSQAIKEQLEKTQQELSELTTTGSSGVPILYSPVQISLPSLSVVNPLVGST